MSHKLIANEAKYSRRSFDFDWLKSQPIFAQDDSIILVRALETRHRQDDSKF